MRLAMAGVAGTLVALATSAVASPALAAELRPSVLLITVDTLRPDALGWVSGHPGTPALDRLAEGGFRFPAAVAPVPLTLPSHVTLMTGLVPPRHGVRDNGEQLGEGIAVLAETLSAAGYATAAFVSGFPLSRPFGLDRGFARYDDTMTAGAGAWLERPAAATTAAAVGWLETAARPWFLWVHYYEPHYPYASTAAGEETGVRTAYDREVQAVDRAAGELLTGGRAAAGDALVTIFAGDHGESLGEHGESTHGYFIYDSTLLVPLVFHYPDVVSPGWSAAPVRLVDVVPTLLDLLALTPLAEADGISLVPLLEGREVELPAAYVETYQPWRSYGWAPLVGLRSADWKWIAAPRPELYRLADDRQEATNLAADEPALARSLDRELREIFRRPAVTATSVEDAETRRRLAALGYVASGGGGAEPTGQEPDPKDRLDLRQLLTEGEDLVERGDLAGALRRFEAVLVREPGSPFALSRSAAVLVRLGRAPEAIARLQRAVAGAPEQVETRALLAESLGAAGEHALAAQEWSEVVRRLPRAPRYWSNLGAELGRSGRPGDAVTALERALELEPSSAERLVRLAFAEFAAGLLPAAAGHLREAAGRQGAGFLHAGALGLVLIQVEEKDEALAWLRRSRPAEPEFAEARFELARLEVASGDREAALRALTEALAAAPALRSRAVADRDLVSLLEP